MKAKKHNKLKQHKNTTADEQTILVCHKHLIVLRRQFIFGSLGILLPLLLYTSALNSAFAFTTQLGWLVLISMVIVLFYWLRAWVGWYYSVYVLTSRRIMVVSQNGFFGREVSELGLDNIQNVNYKIRGFQASVMGYGDVIVETLSGSKPLRLRRVGDPVSLQQAILEVMRRSQSSN